MKKLAFILASLSIGLSTSAFAAGTAILNDGKVKAGEDGCELISEDVKINLSSGVSGAYNCNEATNTITVAACHKAGSRKPQVTCAIIGQNGEDHIWNDDSCNEVGEVIEGSGPDYRGFFGQTSGGSVGAAFLNGTCSGALLAAHEKMGD